MNRGELRSLSVIASLDPSGVATGARTIVTETDKIVQSFNTARAAGGRLESQFVDNARSAQQAVTALGQLEYAASKGNLTLARQAEILLGISNRYRVMVDAEKMAAAGMLNVADAARVANAELAKQQAILADQDKFQARSKYDPRFAAIQQYRDYAAQAREDFRKGLIDQETMTSAVNRQRHATLDLIRVQREGDQRRSTRQYSANSLNAAAQFQDIAITAAMGQSPLTIALQQGTQLSAVFSQLGDKSQSVGALLRSAFSSILSPMSLATIGVVAVSAAVIQYGMTWFATAKDVKDATDKHEENIKALAAAWGISASAANKYFKESEVGLERAAEKSRKENEKLLLIERQRLGERSYSAAYPTLKAGVIPTSESPFASAVEGVRTGALAVSEFEKEVKRIGASSPALKSIADQILDLSGAAFELEAGLNAGEAALSDFARNAEKNAERVKSFKDALKSLSDVAKPAQSQSEAAGKAYTDALKNAFTIGESMDAYEAFAAAKDRIAAETAKTLRENQAIFDADASGIGAKSPAAKERAARAREAANVVELEDKQITQQRILLAGQKARIEAEHQLAEAQKERVRALNEAVDQQEFDLSLIGKSTAEAAKLRFEFERINSVRKEAEKNGVGVDPREVDLIRQAADEYARIKATAEALQSIEAGKDEIDRITLENSLIFSNADARTRAIAAYEAELKIRKLGIDTYGAEAQAIRTQSALLASLQNQQSELERTRAAWESIFDAAREGIDGVVDALFDQGASIEDVGRKFARLMFDMAVTNPLKNWLTGSQLPNIADLGIFGSGATSGRGGGFGGVLGNILGAQKVVGSMQVQAGAVVINGGLTGGLGGLGSLLGGAGGGFSANTSLTDLISRSANSNYMPGAVQRFQLPALGAVQPLSDAAFNARFAGLASGGASRMSQFRDAIASIESLGSGGYSAIGPTHKTLGRALGRYQMMEANIGPWSKAALGKSVSASDFLANPGLQDKIFDHRFGGYVNKYGESGAASMWFTGRPSAPNARDVLGTSGAQYVEKFNKALERGVGNVSSLSSGASQAASGLTQFGSGLGNLGSMLQNIPSAISGSGWFQGLASMFGGAAGALQHMMGMSPGITSVIMAGGGGLFANGAAFSRGSVVPHVFGGVVDRPALFPMSGGRTGMLGEAGPEAIMPLRRDGSGRLGVYAGFHGFANSNNQSPANMEKAFDTLAKRLSPNIKNINVLDKSLVGEFLRTDEGEQVLMNVLRKTGRA